ncbi:MAG: alpha/beta hydrolase domain-containing protein [Bauldia sp.]
MQYNRAYRRLMTSVAAAAVATLASTSLAHAKITRIKIDCAQSQSPTFCPGQSPTFEGKSFGTVGQYEKIRGTAFGELNPLDPHNAVITDIALAPRNAKGNVEYSTDIFILKPVDLAKGNHRMFVDYNNRGAMRLGTINGGIVTNDPTTAADAGQGFILNLGYSVVSMGWDPGANDPRNPKLMKISVPVAKYPAGSATADVTGAAYEYIVFDRAGTTSSDLTYPAASLEKSKATLTVRDRLDDKPTAIDAAGWEYASPTSIRLLPAGTAFKKSAIYEFAYTAKDPVVAGIGLAATRDVISFFRNAKTDNPLAGDIQHTYSFSISQPSRTLNDFVALGFNQDEDGKRVIDGILSHTAGGNGDQINYRFAYPGRTERNRQNHLFPEGMFPFAHQTTTDHLTGKTAGRDDRCTATNTCPKRFEVNTSNEYWVKAGSLLTTDSQGRDLKEPKDVRYYLMSGLSHGVGNAAERGSCQQFTNPTSPYPAHRALLVALDKWVTAGTPPPASRIPTAANSAKAVTRPGSQTGTVPQQDLGWPSIPGVTYTGTITTRYVLDFGPDFATSGVVSNYPPSVVGRPSYPIFVPKVDRDGNEIAGVRLPAVAAPIATTTGWAVRAAEFGGPDGCESDGQHIPFAATLADRQRTGDPRLSLEERYKTHDGYVKAVAAAAQRLEKEGFLLPADVKAYIDEAQASNVLRGAVTAKK